LLSIGSLIKTPCLSFQKSKPLKKALSNKFWYTLVQLLPASLLFHICALLPSPALINKIVFLFKIAASLNCKVSLFGTFSKFHSKGFLLSCALNTFPFLPETITILSAIAAPLKEHSPSSTSVLNLMVSIFICAKLSVENKIKIKLTV